MGSSMKRLWIKCHVQVHNHMGQPERTQPFPSSLSGDRPPWESPGDLYSWACWQGSLVRCDDRVPDFLRKNMKGCTWERKGRRDSHAAFSTREALQDPGPPPCRGHLSPWLAPRFQSEHNPPVPTVPQVFIKAKTVPQGWGCASRREGGPLEKQWELQPQDNTTRERLSEEPKKDQVYSC